MAKARGNVAEKRPKKARLRCVWFFRVPPGLLRTVIGFYATTSNSIFMRSRIEKTRDSKAKVTGPFG